MPLTRSFKETIRARVQRDPAFCAALLTEGAEALLSGDVESGKAILEYYIIGNVFSRKCSDFK